MKDILTLDCTLRDGGYCNEWNFKDNNIRRIISGVKSSGVEIVECGFLTNRIEYCRDKTKYTDLKQLESVLPPRNGETKYVVMMNYGEYDIDSLPKCEDTCIDGIRIAFHKSDRYQALELCEKVVAKGYLLFIQPMVSMLYTDEEFIEFIKQANSIQPYAFYIVDSFGMMDKRDLAHYFYLAETTLSKDIIIGFHSHNNLQSAFSNAQSLIERESERTCIIDGSVYGMGRGAGNLNLELLLNELNKHLLKNYYIKPILQIMDEIINRFYEEKPWGYSLPNYLSAVYMIHPNYAGYLSEKKTLSIDDIDEIFSMMKRERACEYNEKYVDSLYVQYMSAGVAREAHLRDIKRSVKGRKILLVAPGRTILAEKEIVLDFIEKNSPIVISINHECPIYSADYIFVSNIRRFKNLNEKLYGKTISTTNIKSLKTYVSIDYFKLLNDVEAVRDNAGLMAIKFVKDDLCVDQVYLAGLDGYSHEVLKNFETEEMALIASFEFLDKINDGMRKIIEEYKKHITIKSITTSKLI